MKKKLLFTATVLGGFLLFTSCGEKKINEDNLKKAEIGQEKVEEKPIEKKEGTINFVGPFDLTVRLTTTDNWETAELMDNSGKIHKLEHSPAASGIFLKNNEGVSIHFKNGEGTLILNNGNEIQVKEFKN